MHKYNIIHVFEKKLSLYEKIIHQDFTRSMKCWISGIFNREGAGATMPTYEV